MTFAAGTPHKRREANSVLTRRQFLTAGSIALSGYLAGCAQLPPVPFLLMGATGSSAKKYVKSQAVKPVLDEILKQVNNKFVYESDRVTYGVAEYWNVAGEETKWRGDCEDHALLCRKLAIERGIESCSLVTCWTEKNRYHCVLYVDGWIIDVRYPCVMSNSDLLAIGYSWHKIGLPNGHWYYIESVNN